MAGPRDQAGQKSPVHGLSQSAIDLIHQEQPLQRAIPDEDPLVILNALDNTDKHDDLNPAFVYPDVKTGLELIDIIHPRRVKISVNLWTAGQPLDNGTLLARFVVTGYAHEVLRARDQARLGYATGLVDGARTSYVEMIDRVRDIADKAAALIDHP